MALGVIAVNLEGRHGLGWEVLSVFLWVAAFVGLVFCCLRIATGGLAIRRYKKRLAGGESVEEWEPPVA